MPTLLEEREIWSLRFLWLDYSCCDENSFRWGAFFGLGLVFKFRLSSFNVWGTFKVPREEIKRHFWILKISIFREIAASNLKKFLQINRPKSQSSPHPRFFSIVSQINTCSKLIKSDLSNHRHHLNNDISKNTAHQSLIKHLKKGKQRNNGKICESVLICDTKISNNLY